MVGSTKQAMDATHSLYNATLDKVLPIALWLEYPACVNQFTYALGIESKTTVTKCASIMVLVIEAAREEKKPNLLMTAATVLRIEAALAKWTHVYRISDSLERIYTCLYELRPDSTMMPKRKRRTFTLVSPLAVAKRTLTSVSRAAASLSRRDLSDARGPRSKLVDSKRSVDETQQKPPVAPSLPAKKDTTLTASAVEIGPPVMALARLRRPSIAVAYAAVLQVLMLGKPPEAPDMLLSVIKEDVLAAAEVRRSQRLQFIEILQRAYDFQTGLCAKGRQAPKVRTKRFGFQDAIDSAVGLYHMSDECAIHDYVETALDPTIQDFLVPFLKAYVKPVWLNEQRWWHRLCRQKK
ncbi:hypothetical protein ACHHYP_06015 [Achlya hypogyna]|uniref:Uncharacterized protein n=1 Tax=Achlya hypogyna TaxID=1202772 RepID=A0A1V9ZNC4_ACHHY|nr:hypothetical protein ACHHYP_06015 [Achlya hypogyna]